MTPKNQPPVVEPRVTLDDIKAKAELVKHQAEALRDKAVTEAKDTVDQVMGPQSKKALYVVAGVVLVVASVAYFAGARRGKAAASEAFLGE